MIVSWPVLNTFYTRINAILLFLCLSLIAVYYFQAPDTVPNHLNMAGEADGYGSKKMLFVLAMVVILQYSLLSYLANNLNSPLLNVPESMREQPQIGKYFVLTCQTFILLLFAALIYDFWMITNSSAYLPQMFLSTMVTFLLYCVLFLLLFSRYFDKKTVSAL